MNWLISHNFKCCDKPVQPLCSTALPEHGMLPPEKFLVRFIFASLSQVPEQTPHWFQVDHKPSTAEQDEIRNYIPMISTVRCNDYTCTVSFLNSITRARHIASCEGASSISFCISVTCTWTWSPWIPCWPQAFNLNWNGNGRSQVYRSWKYGVTLYLYNFLNLFHFQSKVYYLLRSSLFYSILHHCHKCLCKCPTDSMLTTCLQLNIREVISKFTHDILHYV